MISKEIKQTLLLAWPLFLGLFMIMSGNGLQGTLLGLRASIEGFPVFVTGIVMSLYYAGFFIGCLLTPKMLSSVGHIRVFAALASIASTTILLHGVFVDPILWGIVRVISGISFAGLFIVSESWLNSIATNKLRAKIFGFYLMVTNGGHFAGQFLVNVAPLEDIGLFILVSILVSLSLLPLTLANKPSPGFETTENLPIKSLFKSSQLALASVFASGVCAGTIFGIGAVYATESGQSSSWAAAFIATYIAGSATIPLVLGSISDNMDRRKMIIMIAFGGFAVASLFVLAENIQYIPFILIYIMGGFVTSLYGVGLAYMNDHIRPEQSVSASTTLILVNGCGAMLGPLIGGAVMDMIGTTALFVVFSVVFLALFVFGIYRAKVGRDINVEEQGEFVSVPVRSSPAMWQITEDDVENGNGNGNGEKNKDAPTS